MWTFLALAIASPLSVEREDRLAGVVQAAELVFTGQVEGCRPMRHHLPSAVVEVVRCRLVVDVPLLGEVVSGRIELSLPVRWGGLPTDTELLVIAHTMRVGTHQFVKEEPAREHLPVYADVVAPVHPHTILRRAEGVAAPLWAETVHVVGRRDTPWPELGWGAVPWTSLIGDVRAQTKERTPVDARGPPRDLPVGVRGVAPVAAGGGARLPPCRRRCSSAGWAPPKARFLPHRAWDGRVRPGPTRRTCPRWRTSWRTCSSPRPWRV